MRKTLESSERAKRGSRLLQSWSARRAAHRRSRLVSVRHRRALAQGMRAVARAAADQTSPSRWNVLLRRRAAPLRTELLQVAAMVERVHEPDVACIAALDDLLRDGAKSPLYNPKIDPRELAVTLDCVRRALEPDTGSRATAGHSKFY
jgi:hypothetical protein